MKDGKTIPMQIRPDKELHSEFKAKCSKERNIPMKTKILELMKEWVEK